jgi:hydroxyacylglutathione hydrolase
VLLEVRSAPPFYKNGFVLGCETTREAVLIDPGDEVDQLLDVVRAERLAVQYVLLTHGHVDHVSGAARAKAVLGAPVCLHSADRVLYAAAPQQAMLLGLHIVQPPAIDCLLEDGDRLAFGQYQARIHHTPGHSPGGICVEVGRQGRPGSRLFVGDTLFLGTVGRTDLPGGSGEALLRSIREVLLPFPDDTEVYPGHGPGTTIGAERRTNPFLKG